MYSNAAFDSQPRDGNPREAARASRLAQIAELATRADEYEEVLAAICAAAVQLTEARGALVALLGTATEPLTVATTAGLTPFRKGALVPPEIGAVTVALAEGRPVMIADRGETGEDEIESASDTAGYAVVPLRGYGRGYGVLIVAYDRVGTAEARDDAAFLEQLAAATVPPAASWRAEALERRVTEALSIVEIGRALTELRSMDEVFSYVTYLAESLVGGNCAAVGLLTDDRKHLVLCGCSGTLHAIDGAQIPLQGSLMGWVVEHDEVVITPCVSDDERSFPAGARQGPGIVVPIKNRGEVLGAFLVARHDGLPELTGASAQTLQRMSAYAAIAITNARANTDQAEAAARLAAQAAELKAANDALENSREGLLVAEKMAALGKVTAGIAHEINSPLGSILNSLRMVKGYTEEYHASAADPEITADDHRAIAKDILGMVEMAEAAAQKVGQFVRSIKGQTRYDAHAASVLFDPAREVDSIVTLMQHQLRDSRVALFTDIEPGLCLHGDPAKLGFVVQNLVSNAIDAYEEAGGEVWVRMRRSPQAIEMEVEDRGSGIPEEIRHKIFDYLFTTKDVGKGTGLGLSAVHNIVTTHFGGTVDLRSEVGRGTVFLISLPVPSGQPPLAPNNSDGA